MRNVQLIQSGKEKLMKKLKCHCGAIEAEINVPENLEKVLRCNCSLCKRKGAVMSWSRTMILK